MSTSTGHNTRVVKLLQTDLPCETDPTVITHARNFTVAQGVETSRFTNIRITILQVLSYVLTATLIVSN